MMRNATQIVLTNFWATMELDFTAWMIDNWIHSAMFAVIITICITIFLDLVFGTNQLLPSHSWSLRVSPFFTFYNQELGITGGDDTSQTKEAGRRTTTVQVASAEQTTTGEETSVAVEMAAKEEKADVKRTAIVGENSITRGKTTTSEKATSTEEIEATKETFVSEQVIDGGETFDKEDKSAVKSTAVRDKMITREGTTPKREKVVLGDETGSTEEITATMETNGEAETFPSEATTKIQKTSILQPAKSGSEEVHAKEEQPDGVKVKLVRKFRCPSSSHKEEYLEEYGQATSEKLHICSPASEYSDEEESQAPSTDDVMDVQDFSDLEDIEASDETDNSLYHNNAADYTTSTQQQYASISLDTNIQLPEGQETDAIKETVNNSQDVNLFNSIHDTDIYIDDTVVPAAVDDNCHGDCEEKEVFNADAVRSDTNIDRSCTDTCAVMDDITPPMEKRCEKAGDTQPCSLRLGEKIYNLETASAADEYMTEYTEIPNELNDLIADICSDEEVYSAMVYQSPSDSKELLIVGVGANKNVEAKIQAAVRKNFPEFTIYTDSIKHHLEHTNPYANKKAFTAYKEQLDKDDKTYSNVSRATCELVLEGQAMADRLHTSTSFYALLPAHFVLDTEDCMLLTTPQDHEAGRKHVQEIIIAKVVNSRYRLSMLHPAKIIKLRPDDLMYSYRPHQQEDHGGPMHFSSFYNDLYLLEIEKSFFFERKETLINLPDLEDGMKTTPDGKAIGEILPVMSNAQLVQMGVSRVKVEVGSSTGYMTWAGIPVQQKKGKEGVVAERNDKPQAFHAQFIIEDRPLMPGHSGSIVYVIDATSKVRYRFGMLFGEAKRAHKNTVTVFQALVLQQGIAELEHRYSHKVKDLRPLASSDSSIGEGFSPILKRLEKYGSSSSVDLVKERKEMSEVKVSTVRPVSATPPVTANRFRETEMNSSHAEEGFGSGQLETEMAADQSVMEGGERTSHSIGLDSSAHCELPESHLQYSSTTFEDQMSDPQQAEKQSLPSDNLGDSGFESVANRSMDNLSGTSLPDNQ